MSAIKIYNKVIRTIAVNQAAPYGFDTPRARKVQARALRDLRSTYPLSSLRRDAA